MASTGRKKVVASRRRRADEGEEEGSLAGDLEDNSLSEGSIISNGDDDADIEPSDISEDDAGKARHSEREPGRSDVTLPTKGGSRQPEAQVADSKFVTSSDTKAMMNGLQIADGGNVAAVEFDETTVDAPESAAESSISQAKFSQEAPAERNRREHLEYLKQKKENPAFVPNRGGFFLHDNRAAPSGPNGFRVSARGRGRGAFGGFLASRGPPFVEPTDQPWAHDLHDSVSTVDSRNADTSKTILDTTTAKASVSVPVSAREAPNRSFSTSILLGKVPVIVHLPGMQDKRVVQNVAKKKHTLLPQHRPPLRRDKPVRVSLPNQQPRYIFPSTERSFIFIPRAMRPNQQGFGRGRGRGSFNPSRRTSVYGSTYTPSVAMSRRSSFGGIMAGDGVRSPGGAALPLLPSHAVDQSKPVVRLPPAARPIAGLPGPPFTYVNGAPSTAGPHQPILPSQGRQENVPDAMTMHQPRPQKTVSVADIESPARFHFNPPPQQQEQPFHQQMPIPVNSQMYAEEASGFNAHVRRMSHVSRPSGTPLSQIPERAIYAQPFQPFPPPPQVQGYLPSHYPPGAVFYPAMQPTMQSDMAGYGSSLGPPMAPPFLAGAHPAPYMVPAANLPAPTANGNVPAATVAHESNGMVYYYDSSQVPPSTGAPYSAPFAGAPAGGVVGMGGMMTPPNHFYYPVPNNGVYYAAP